MKEIKKYFWIIMAGILILAVVSGGILLTVNIRKNIIAVSNVKQSGIFTNTVHKVVVISPHPDDEVIGCGGVLLNWLATGKEVHVVFITDGRAAYTFCRKQGQLIESKETRISEAELAEIRMKEVDKVDGFLGIPAGNIHKLRLPDQGGHANVAKALPFVTEIIKDADIIVQPSNHSIHVDHQAAYDIATRAAQALRLTKAKFVIYMNWEADKLPVAKLLRFDIRRDREKLHQALLLYKSQQYLTFIKDSYQSIQKKDYEALGWFTYADMGKFYNF